MTHDEMVERLVSNLVEDMDLESLVMYAQERLVDSYSKLTDEELRQELEQFYPHLLEDLQ